MGEGDRTFGYVGALDGLRAFAVAVVLVFHAELGGAEGGFLGVSVFFTLSGFLITSLLVAEHERTGTVDLGAFYARRGRRLLPAAYACIAGALLLGPWWVATQRQDLPGDVIASVANVANWRFAFAERSYQDLFLGAPSPLAHFWSLAIEEQCYLLLPLVAAWALRRGGVRRLAAVLALLTTASVVSTLLTSDPDLVYNGTHTRAAELLIGALVALVVRRRLVGARVGAVAATGGLAVLVALVVSVDLRTGWLYRGGFAAVAVVSAITVVGLLGAHLPARLLAARPIVAIGRRSYGVYLYHWPVFLVLTADRTGLGTWPLLALRLAATGLLVVVSYRLLEVPVRRARLLVTPLRARWVAGVAAAGLVVAALVAVPDPGFTRTEVLLALGDDDTVEFTLPSTTVPPPPPPPVVLVVGSSSAPVAALRSAGFEVVDGTDPACPVVAGAELQLPDGTVIDTSACTPAASAWPALLASVSPDAVVLAGGPLDLGLVRTVDQLGFPTAADLAGVADRLTVTEAGVRDALDLLRGVGVPVLLYRESAVADPLRLDEVFGHAAVSEGEAVPVHRELTGLVDAARRALDELAAEGPGPVRLLVVGDSTSLDLAQALSDGGDGRLAVLWAGANGCPFVRTEARRTSPDVPWGEEPCPDFAAKLPPLLASFRPDAVLVVAGPTELSEQRYAGDPAGHVAGDPAYTSFHDAEMAAFLAAVPVVPVLVADAVPIRAGRWATPEMASPERLAAWQAQIDRWDDASPRVTVFPYAAALAEFEATHGDLRADGVHPDVVALTDLARATLVPRLVAAVVAAD
ncbi:MAG: hypothetical protein RL238_466 [Actinomycetota bacterium]|jgi:peptidoglycan/LPS O-acetylase OafA/YrhL